jgi:hypothetical protein
MGQTAPSFRLPRENLVVSKTTPQRRASNLQLKSGNLPISRPLQIYPLPAKAPELRTYPVRTRETSKKIRLNGGRYKVRTCGHYDVNVVLYR